MTDILILEYVDKNVIEITLGRTPQSVSKSVPACNLTHLHPLRRKSAILGSFPDSPSSRPFSSRLRKRSTKHHFHGPTKSSVKTAELGRENKGEKTPRAESKVECSLIMHQSGLNMGCPWGVPQKTIRMRFIWFILVSMFFSPVSSKKKLSYKPIAASRFARQGVYILHVPCCQVHTSGA